MTTKEHQAKQPVSDPELWGVRLSDRDFEVLKTISAQYQLDPLTGEIQMLRGKVYISAAGLQVLACRHPDYEGCEIEIVHSDWEKNFYVVKAKVWKKGCAHPFEDFGDADPSTSQMKGRALFRHAITRARSRAIRSAFAVPFCSVEEMDAKGVEQMQVVREKPAPKTEPRITQPKVVKDDSPKDELSKLRGQYRAVSKESSIHPKVHETIKLRYGTSNGWSVEFFRMVISQLQEGHKPEFEQVVASFRDEMLNKEYDNQGTDREFEQRVRKGDIECSPWLLHNFMLLLDSWKIGAAMDAFCESNGFVRDWVRDAWDFGVLPLRKTQPIWEEWKKYLLEDVDQQKVKNFEAALKGLEIQEAFDTLKRWIHEHRKNPATCVAFSGVYRRLHH